MTDLNLKSVAPVDSSPPPNGTRLGAQHGHSQYLPLLLLLFIGSGCAALIYEIVWFQLLQLVIGSTAYSLATLLGVFMGGMCLGSLILPLVVSGKHHPLRVYGILEAGIGVMGMAVLVGMPHISHIYAANVGPGTKGLVFRAIACAVCLLLPTMMMGATLPAISRWVRTTPAGVSWLGFFYGGNTIGAVFGCLFAGFYLLRKYDTTTATFVAVYINATVALLALLALLLSAWVPHRPHVKAGIAEAELPQGDVPPDDVPRDDLSPRCSWDIYFVIALSGMSALGAEVVWTRLLSLLLGGTVYTFSIILAVLLVGLAIGSSVGAMIAGGTGNARRALGVCQLLLTAAIAWTAYTIAKSLPYWPINPQMATDPIFLFQIDLLRCIWAILPACILWGASFPLALAAVARPGKDPGKLVGGVYAANTLGAIAGAVVFSLYVIPHWGTPFAQQALIVIAGISASLVFFSGWRTWSPVEVIGLAAAELAIVLMVLGVSAVPWELVAYGRLMSITNEGAKEKYVGEGINSTIAITEMPNGTRNFHVAGKVEASSEPADMRLQRMLGHLPALLSSNPRSVLVVGCGAGVTAGSFVVHPELEKLTICEIEPLIPANIPGYFTFENHNLLKDPRLTIVYDDARHFVLTTQEKFDIITSDPIHPWVKGAATLYTKEYFQMVKDHLNPGGLVTQWVPLYESNEPAVKSEIATFLSVFPNGTVWSNDISGAGYDVVLLGRSDDAMKINIDALQARLDRNDYGLVHDSLKDVNFNSAIDLLATFAGQGADLKTWLAGTPINLDRNLRLQYIAGLGLNANEGDKIYRSLRSQRKFPEDLFEGSQDSLLKLRAAISKDGGPQ